MKIAEVKKLDDGVNGIITEGKVIKILKDPNENEYGWSQFIKIKDDTGDMACWVNIETEEDAYKVGQYIKIKGKVNKYTKGNKAQVSFSGNVIDEIRKDEEVSQEQPTQTTTQKPVQTQEEPEKDMNKVWEDKDLRIARESALKNVAEYIKAGLVKLGNRFDYAHEDVDFIYNGLEKKVTSEAITEEFGGTTVEEKPENSHDNSGKDQKIEGQIEEGAKSARIAQARELVRNPHLAEPVDDTMATVKQKKQIYGYINEDAKKVGGIIDSQYLTEKEKEGIGDWQVLTKTRAIAMWEAWYGKEGELGERDKRELAAKEKESPFATKRDKIETRDPKDDASLAKDLIVEKINDMRKTYGLLDEKKFMEAFGCNAKFERWTEKELNILKEKLEMWKPDWVTGK